MIHNPLNLVLPSEMESLQTLDSFMHQLIAATQLDPDASASVMVSTFEAVTNAIRHGNRFNPVKKVRITFCVEPSRIHITVADEGQGFRPDDVKDPTDPANLEREGGRGVFLIRQLADEVRFHDDGRCVEMAFVCSCSFEASRASDFASLS